MDGEDYQFQVQAGAQFFEVWLWPGDVEWECTCEVAACAHAFAALLALEGGVDSLEDAAEAPQLGADLRSAGDRLDLTLFVRQGEVDSPFTGALPSGLSVSDELRSLMRLSSDWQSGRVPPRQHGILLRALRTLDLVRLDGDPISVSRVPLDAVIRVRPTGAGYRLSLDAPPGTSRSWPGDPPMILAEGCLRPRGFGKLSKAQRNRLASPVLFAEHELPRLTSEWLPSLKKLIKVIEEDGVPEAGEGGLQTMLELHQAPGLPGTLEVCARLVYGDPPVAEVIGDRVVPLGGLAALPARDIRGEQQSLAHIQQHLGLRAGQRRRLEGERALNFVATKLPSFRGLLLGADVAKHFRLQGHPLEPRLRWGARLDMSFASESAAVSPDRVLAAYRRGDRVVPLASGGFAELPINWLDEHAGSLELLLQATGDAGGPAAHLGPLALQLGAEVDERASFDPRDLHSAIARGDDGTNIPLPDGLEGILRSYQVEGYRWLSLLGQHGLGAVLADDMGLGKTLQTLSSLAGVGTRTTKPTLVIAPTSVLVNWQREAARWVPHLRSGQLHGPKRGEVLAQLKRGELDLGVTSYGVMRRDIDELSTVDWHCVVLDEAQAIKNADSQTARAARRLQAGRRIALTGTPIENHLGELWSLMDFINPGFFGPERHFQERLGEPARNGDPGALAALRARVRPFILRRLKRDVAPELPPRTETILRCPMSEGQRRAYQSVQRAARNGLPSEQGPRRLQVLAALTRLRQAACDAALVNKEASVRAPSDSGKLDRLEQMLEPLLEEGHKVLIFSQWTSLLDLVEPRLEARDIQWLRLDGTTRERQNVVDQFQTDDGPPVFLISLKAGGTGLNLTAADHVIHLDPWWNPAAEQQAEARAHRIGQTKPVFVWKLIAENSVEEGIVELQQRKSDLADAVLEGQNLGTAVSLDDLEGLLG